MPPETLKEGIGKLLSLFPYEMSDRALQGNIVENIRKTYQSEEKEFEMKGALIEGEEKILIARKCATGY